MTLYAVDVERKELFSKFLVLDAVREIRVPISDRSIAGYSAMYRQIVNIADAYDKAELNRVTPTINFDSSWARRRASAPRRSSPCPSPWRRGPSA